MDTIPSQSKTVVSTDHFILQSVRPVTFNILGSRFMVPRNLLNSETDACDESQTAFTKCCSPTTQVEECSYLALCEGQLFRLQTHVAPFYSELLETQHCQFYAIKENERCPAIMRTPHLLAWLACCQIS
jgi:hypothetical protein